MTQIFGLSDSHEPPAKYSHIMIQPDIPFTTLLNTIILLLDAYNVRHNGQLDDTAGMSVETGNQNRDERFMADYMSFKMFLDALNRDYQEIICQIQGTGQGLYMTFQCR